MAISTADSCAPPLEIDPLHLRTVLGSFATGVTAVCARTTDGDPLGLTVSSFTPVSLEPPLVSFCVKAGSWSWEQIQLTGRFAVSVLAAGHADLCRALSRPAENRFDDIDWFASPSGSPLISGALAWFDCRVHAAHTAGDHDIVLGWVEHLDMADHRPDPLVFFRSELRGL
jgi:3-hydroxy-9,10-secoandrosta-1,3,5(10)-triene-9,17-dione monooxygenase reductase component